MRICVFEDVAVSGFYPLSLTRPVFALRCGTGTLLDRQMRYFGATEVGVHMRPDLDELTRLVRPDLHVNDAAWLRSTGEIVFVNARWLAPTLIPPLFEPNGVGLVGDQVAWIVVSGRELEAMTEDSPRPWEKRDHPDAQPAGGVLLEHLWQLVERNAEAIREDFTHFSARESTAVLGAVVKGPVEQVFIDPSASVESHVFFDVTRGPIVIDQGAVVDAFSRLEGPCYVGPNSRVVAAKLRSGTTLGRGCRVGGEVEASILHGFVNKYHEGFVGHSYVGGWVNFGAGTQISDLRNDYAPISVYLAGKRFDTGQIKVGAYLGDFTRTSIGALLNAGTVVGPFGQMLASGTLLPRSVPPFCQTENGRLKERPDLRLMFEAAATAVGRRDRQWTETHVEFFFQLFVQTEPERRKAIRESEQRRMRRVV